MVGTPVEVRTTESMGKTEQALGESPLRVRLSWETQGNKQTSCFSRSNVSPDKMMRRSPVIVTLQPYHVGEDGPQSKTALSPGQNPTLIQPQVKGGKVS